MLTDHPEPIDLAISFWHSQGICFDAPVTEIDIKSLFADCGRSVTADVLELYQRVNGFADGECCWNHWSLWSLAKIREENQFNPSQDIWFADYLINSYYFSLHPEDSQSSSVHVQVYDKRGVDTFKVADTLTEFLRLLLSDPESVHVFPLGDAKN